MRKKNEKLILRMGIAVLLLGGITGCGKVSDANAGGRDKEPAGSVQIVGSTSMRKLTEALAESFMEKNEGVVVNVEFVGSGAGIEAVANGRADIGNSSRNLKEEESKKGVVENVVAIDGIAVCVDRTNKVGGLTRRQLANIYMGVITNWRDVGGEDMPIVVIGREAGSGTRETFEKYLEAQDRCAYANELDSTGAVMARVASTPGAIGYVSLDVADDSVRTLCLDGVAPTAENIRAQNYSLIRPLVMATKGEISRQSGLVRAWFEFVYSGEGREIAEQLGLIAVE